MLPLSITFYKAYALLFKPFKAFGCIPPLGAPGLIILEATLALVASVALIYGFYLGIYLYVFLPGVASVLISFLGIYFVLIK